MLFILLFARVFLSSFGTGLAVDTAAPVELAPALPRPRELVCVVAAAAAHQVASVSSWIYR